MANIEIGGRLHSTATGNVVTGANEVLDDIQNKKQQEINTELIEAVGTVDSRIVSAVATETSRAQEAEANRYTKSETYNKEEVNNLITTPNQEYVSVTATSETTSITDILPTTGAANTIYRVGNWDGTQYNDSVFSEYAWDGSTYVLLNVKEYGIDDVPTAGSNNLVKSSGVFNNIGAFDISELNATENPHTLATYEDLASALNALPASYRKGGMTVKFVQSSDNKYVQYRLTADEFTTDTTQWAIADEGTYIENPEFVYVRTDAEGKILWAIKIDGGIYYGAGIPQQVIDYVEKKIADLSLDEYEDIVAFLNGLSEGDKTLQMLLNEKVDKEEGKSLINTEYAEGVHYIESPEFAEIKVDAEQRILEATYKDGTKLFPAGFRVNGVAEYGGAIVTTITNPEFTAVWLDNSNRILLGIKNNADIFLGYGVPSQIKTYIDEEINKVSPEGVHEIIAFIGEYLGSTTLQELLDKKVDGEYIENPEYAETRLDSNNKIIEATRKDGTKVIGGNLQVLGSLDINGIIYSVVSNSEWLKVVVDTYNRVICGIKVDGKFYVGDADFLDDIKTIKARLDIFSTIDNPEFIDVKTDADDRIVEFIRNDGTKVLPAGVETPKVNLKGATTENKANPEYVEVKVDAENKLLEGTKTDGTKVIGGNLEVSNDLKVDGDVEVGGNVSYKNGIPQAIIDYVAANTGSGITNIEYEDETGDMYATFDDADGVTDVYMEENGDIYAEIEE